MYGLYIHIPFCLKKCKYCDFVSFDNNHQLMGEYIDALVREMKEYEGMLIDTIFIGGGTPTILPLELLEKLLVSIRDSFKISNEYEFTIEANPKTVTKEKLDLLKKYGVNRISLGVQTFNEDELKIIGRVHTSDDAKETIRLIKSEGFPNVNIDLMSALPEQTMLSFKDTLNNAIKENPQHISCYSLILEENTPLMKEYEEGKLKLPDENEEREMYEYACEFLKENGYEQYEISNFSKVGMESRHNIKYWECREYIGIGIATASYYNGARYKNTDCIGEYIKGGSKKEEYQTLTIKNKIEEFMMMGLRMTKGVSKKEFESRFKMEIGDIYKEEIERFKKSDLLIEDGDRIYLSRRGIHLSNSVMCEFLDPKISQNDD